MFSICHTGIDCCHAVPASNWKCAAFCRVFFLFSFIFIGRLIEVLPPVSDGKHLWWFNLIFDCYALCSAWQLCPFALQICLFMNCCVFFLSILILNIFLLQICHFHFMYNCLNFVHADIIIMLSIFYLCMCFFFFFFFGLKATF